MRISVLDTIPGLGDARRDALLRHFGSVKRLREAELEALAEVPGVGPKMAEKIKRYLDRDAQLEEGKQEVRREMQVRRRERQ
jgi:excinuclease ABC subunit C